MTYPPPRYTGTGGETSARVRPGDTPAALRLGGTTVHHLATGATTDGGFGLYRWEMDGSPGGATPHFHRTFSESFLVLSGAVRLFDGVREVDGTEGDFLHVPPGGVHGFRNDSGAPAVMLLLFVPGAPREDYFAALADLAASGRALDPAARAAFLARHDQYEVQGAGPPAGAADPLGRTGGAGAPPTG